MITHVERRVCTRINVRLEVEYTICDMIQLTGATRDISLKGLYMLTDRRPEVGTECVVVLLLAGPRSRLRVKVDGRVARHGPDGIGIEFNDMLMESYLHLRNLVKCRRDVPAVAPRVKIPHMASLRWRQLAGPC